uniref:Uncharacterized protein n=1 Tax=Cucumis melo TaxID=3656 RepID=A0A9I9DHF4_CUCME
MQLDWTKVRTRLEKRKRLAHADARLGRTADERLVRFGKNDANDGEQTERAPTHNFVGLRRMRNMVAPIGSREGMVRLSATSSEREWRRELVVTTNSRSKIKGN